MKYDAINIKKLLKDQPTKYVLVDNKNVNHAKPSPCWKKFGLPAIRDENNRDSVINKFASCRSCFTTYTYTHGSTKSLNSHKCPKELPFTSSPISSLNSKSSSVYSNNSPLISAKKKTITKLIGTWVCQNMRPISIVEDEGFISIIQKCLTWNTGSLSNISGNDIVPSRWSISREISRQADDIRASLGGVLKSAAEQGVLAISPDLWSDKFKQNNYLGITGHFIDERNSLHSIELCCEPYTEINKRAPNIRKAITSALSKFGLDDCMNKITFVCDRGSNLVKALEDYQVVHCFPHRLNNALKRAFYSAGTRDKTERKKEKKNSNNDQRITPSTWNDFTTRDDDGLMDYDDRDSSESECDDEVVLDEKSIELALRSLSSSSSPESDHINVLEENLPPYAAQILAVISRCKQLCCYVKRVMSIEYHS
ncbi:unnamed protein product [Adineta ricciae]|uniref:Transposase n=1 Tax=Adineta ricciae TaxID=249248 RepID=A0A815NVT7_ADIRI|nr:unnamed protein product [Adineta ricciae]CAF1435171.1 unnamed protein product [Adineta ricciae]